MALKGEITLNKEGCLCMITPCIIFSHLFFNRNILFDMSHTHLKIDVLVDNIRMEGMVSQIFYLGLKPIFHQNAKYLALGAGVGQCPRQQNFVLGIPTCWYLSCENLRYPTPNPRRQTPDAKPKICVRFHLRLVPNANPISGGIWA